MTIWSLLRYAPAIIALWNRMSRTPFNDLAVWGGILSEIVALIARMNGIEVPSVVDVGAVSSTAAGTVHKVKTANEKGFPEWARKALEPKD